MGRGGDVAGAAAGVELLVLAVPDAAVAAVAAQVAPGAAVVAHLAGSLGLDALATHQERAALHPLAALPGPEEGAARLAAGVWWGTAASGPRARRLIELVVADLHGHAVEVPAAGRAAYHAAAAITANHLVALVAQAGEVAAAAGVPLEAFHGLAAGALDSAVALGPAAALTGPVARGDWATVRAHRAALPAGEVAAYDALSQRAARLAGRAWEGD